MSVLQVKNPNHFQTPLVVDLDGTLLRTDALVEGIVSAFFRVPISLFTTLPTLITSRSKFKSEIHKLVDVDVDTLPTEISFENWVRQQAASGREVHLVTAADQSIADLIVKRFPLFHSAVGSTPDRNLKGKEKAKYLRERFSDGFVYAGDSEADWHIWQCSEAAVLVNTGKRVTSKVRQSGQHIEAEFHSTRNLIRSWVSAFRFHQWSKNLLLFVPLFLSHSFSDPSLVARSLLGFLLFSGLASASYIINDLCDLTSDRKHRTKSQRPFASGKIPIHHGALAAGLLIPSLLLAGWVLSTAFALLMVAYLALALLYSFVLKRIVMVDVFCLAFLFTLRVLLGTALIGATYSPWLLTFTMFFFFSLSLAKRHTEVVAKMAKGGGSLAGRGYYGEDAPLTLAMGVSASIASIVIMVLYLSEEAMTVTSYGNATFLWVAPVAIGLWVLRIWLLAHRGQLDEDPVEFAVRDRASLVLGCFVIIAFFMAIIGPEIKL